MRCLTNAEVSAWLAECRITEAPYATTPETSPSQYVQAAVSRDYHCIDAFARHCINEILGIGVCLIHVTDWSLYQPSEMIVIDALRSHHGESRRLIDAPGHLFDASETETAVALFSLCASYGWSCYVYSGVDQSTLLNWEGEMFDFWTANPAKLTDFKALLRSFEFSESPGPS